MRHPFVTSPIIAHRGASFYAPENTLAAFELAAGMGAPWVEADVAMTADGHLVILHDPDVDRTTDGTGELRHLTLADVRELDAGSWFSPNHRDARIPTLAELISCVLDLNLSVQLEIKPSFGNDEALAESIAAAVIDLWPADRPDQLFLSSFSESSLLVAARRLPAVPRAIAHEVIPDDPEPVMNRAGAQMLHVLDPRMLARTPPAPVDEELGPLLGRELEFVVAVVNDPDRGRELLAAGCQSLMTDKPDLLEV